MRMRMRIWDYPDENGKEEEAAAAAAAEERILDSSLACLLAYLPEEILEVIVKVEGKVQSTLPPRYHEP
jgi:hypothetical protein